MPNKVIPEISDEDFSLSRNQRIAVGVLIFAVIALAIDLFFEIQHEGRDVALLMSSG